MKLKYYLIASEQNGYRPWITTPTAIAVFCLVIWGVRLLVPAAFIVAAPGIDATDVMTRVNQERTSRFLPALTINSKLVQAAQIKSNDMLARKYFAHVNPDGQYVWPVIEAAGYKPYKSLGENLAIDFSDAQSMVEAWMNSPSHRANMLNEKFEDQGVGTAYGLYQEPNHYSILATNLFGTLANQPPPPPPPPAQPTPKPSPVPAPQPVPPPAPKPTPPPVIKPTPVPTPKPVPLPTPIPVPTPLPQPTPTSEPTVEIKNGISVFPQTTDEQIVLRIEVQVFGEPKSVVAFVQNARTMLTKGTEEGQYSGQLIVPTSINLGSEVLGIEAIGKNDQIIAKEFTLSQFVEPVGGEPGLVGVSEKPEVSETQLSNTLQIILGIFSGGFLLLLILDSIIIHRARINRVGPHSSPHSILFMLIALVNIITLISY